MAKADFLDELADDMRHPEPAGTIGLLLHASLRRHHPPRPCLPFRRPRISLLLLRCACVRCVGDAGDARGELDEGASRCVLVDTNLGRVTILTYDPSGAALPFPEYTRESQYDGIFMTEVPAARLLLLVLLPSCPPLRAEIMEDATSPPPFLSGPDAAAAGGARDFDPGNRVIV